MLASFLIAFESSAIKADAHCCHHCCQCKPLDFFVPWKIPLKIQQLLQGEEEGCYHPLPNANCPHSISVFCKEAKRNLNAESHNLIITTSDHQFHTPCCYSRTLGELVEKEGSWISNCMI
jgi:hypothetical protein